MQQLERGLIQRALSMPSEPIDLPPLPRSSAAARGHRAEKPTFRRPPVSLLPSANGSKSRP
jgi:hypothetical protein